jgi:uncharacterized protein (TIGR02996 family)
MNPIEERFIATIKDNPNNENNRAVYADWLESVVRLNEAKYLRLEGLIAETRELARGLNVEWIKGLAKVIEVRCPKCNVMATLSWTNGDADFTPEASCSNNRHNWFYFDFISGMKYKFADAIYIYYGGIDNKWWEKCDE